MAALLLCLTDIICSFGLFFLYFAGAANNAEQAAEYGAAERRGQHPRAFAVRNKADQQDKSSSRTISASKVTEETWLTSI